MPADPAPTTSTLFFAILFAIMDDSVSTMRCTMYTSTHPLYHLLTIIYDVYMIDVSRQMYVISIIGYPRSIILGVSYVYTLLLSNNYYISYGIASHHLLVHEFHSLHQSCLAKSTSLVNGKHELFSKLLIRLVLRQKQQIETCARLG
jgi:hypothetical protein